MPPSTATACPNPPGAAALASPKDAVCARVGAAAKAVRRNKLKQVLSSRIAGCASGVIAGGERVRRHATASGASEGSGSRFYQKREAPRLFSAGGALSRLHERDHAFHDHVEAGHGRRRSGLPHGAISHQGGPLHGHAVGVTFCPQPSRRSTAHEPPQSIMADPTLQVLIVDDEQAARHRLEDLLAREANTEVVGQATSGREAVQAIDRLAPEPDAMASTRRLSRWRRWGCSAAPHDFQAPRPTLAGG